MTNQIGQALFDKISSVIEQNSAVQDPEVFTTESTAVLLQISCVVLQVVSLREMAEELDAVVTAMQEGMDASR